MTEKPGARVRGLNFYDLLIYERTYGYSVQACSPSIFNKNLHSSVKSNRCTTKIPEKPNIRKILKLF